jgi:hypothetical protein
MVTHSSTSRPVQCLCMAERTGCPVLTDLWSYVLLASILSNRFVQSIISPRIFGPSTSFGRLAESHPSRIIQISASFGVCWINGQGYETMGFQAMQMSDQVDGQPTYMVDDLKVRLTWLGAAIFPRVRLDCPRAANALLVFLTGQGEMM